MLLPVAARFRAEGGMRRLAGNLGRAIIKTSAVAEDRWTIEAPCRIFDDRNQVLAAFKAGELERDVVVVVYRNHQPKLVHLALRAGARVTLVAVLAEFAVLPAPHVKTGVDRTSAW